MVSQEKISLLLKIFSLEQHRKVPEKPVWRNDLSQQQSERFVNLGKHLWKKPNISEFQPSLGAYFK